MATVRPWVAKFDGKCRRCSGRIVKGESWVRYFNFPMPKPGEPRSVYHADCNTPVGTLPANTAASSEPERQPLPSETTPETTPDDVVWAGDPADDDMPTTPPVKRPAVDSGDFAILALKQALEAAGLAAKQPGLDPKAVEALVNAEVARLMDERFTTRLEVVTPERGAVVIDNAHYMMPRLIRRIANRQHCFVWGPPGSGKSTAVKLAAEALGLRYGYQSLGPQEFPTALKGFLRPVDGVYQSVEFRDFVEHGGVFCLEESDNTSSTVLVTLNNLTANGHAVFPDGSVKVHPDFVLVIVGNTQGRGGDVLFPERRPIDAAFLDRFAVLKWDYDAKHERALALADAPDAGPWVSWLQGVRVWAQAHRKKLLVTPRAAIQGAKDWQAGVPVAEIVDEWLLGRVDADLQRECLTANPLPAQPAAKVA